MTKRRIGIIGFGNLGKFLVSKIIAEDEFELAFVWNRSKAILNEVINPSLILDDISDFMSRKPHIIVEVAHPSITKDFGKMILRHCDYMIGSPTALSDAKLLDELLGAATDHTLYVPSGAFWGGEDIRKMSDAGILQSLKVTMRKHPLSLKLEGFLKEKNSMGGPDAVTLYEGAVMPPRHQLENPLKGCVRDVCGLAPHNTNTMAAAALAAPKLGFDGTIGCLIADPNLFNYHIVEVEAFGHPKPDGTRFHVHTIRKNPAVLGEVTGDATYAAYLGSLKRAEGKGPGLHLC